ncbi:MAG: beta family protein [Rhizobiaceae bacterium]|nr:beta family protein [Rhizobiaceae bacterium]
MLPYRPALRFKQGEYNAVGRIRPEMQKHVRPYFILPPLIEKDPELGRILTHDEIAYVTGERLGKHWPRYPAYMDAQYVMAEPSDEAITRLYQVARARNEKLIAVIPASDLANPLWRSLLLGSFPRAAIHLPAENLDGESLKKGLSALGVDASSCEIFVDFAGLELGLEDVSDVVSGTFSDLAEIANWGCIVFQGSNFPTTNPAEQGKTQMVLRHEWTVFNAAMRVSDIPAERLGFSDFGADCGQINFPTKKGGAIPIPHVRYTTETSTVVIRGKAGGKQSDAMKEVLETLVKRPDFEGRTFSYADQRMWDAANGHATTGSATMWREWNMAHHISRVVRDLAAMAGIVFKEEVEQQEQEQLNMFAES